MSGTGKTPGLKPAEPSAGPGGAPPLRDRTEGGGRPESGAERLTAADFDLVRLTAYDLPGVLRLEKACYPQPWTADNFMGEFNRRVTLTLGLKRGGELAAHCFFWLIAPEVHLLNLAVWPAYRRLGLAGRLLTAMTTIGGRSGIQWYFLEVRPSNAGAVALYESRGFAVTGRRPAYYEDGEDALLMTLEKR